MARTRREKTLADYVVIAISPALIMLLVGSLTFFLLAVGYRGDFGGRLHWILFWFVLAAVLIGRIAIENGNEYASAYSLALGLATALVVARFVDSVLLAWFLLGLIWWCAHVLTWDCTMIDEQADASGEGLLDQVGLDAPLPAAAPPAPKPQQRRKKAAAQPPDPPPPAPPEDTRPRWQKLLGAFLPSSQRAHPPGLYVVYFSLAALPLFGVGQLMLPNDDASRRTYGFQLLWVYVASALGLLLTTSFLGLRRYLRQRKLTMPVKMAVTWMLMGGVLIAGIMALGILVPRPNSQYSLTNLVDRLQSRAQQASQHALLRSDPGKGEGKAAQPTAKQPPDQPAAAQQNGPGQKSEKGAGAPQGADAKQQPDQKQQQPAQAENKGQSKSEGQRPSDQNQKRSKEAQPAAGRQGPGAQQATSQKDQKDKEQQQAGQQQSGGSGQSGGQKKEDSSKKSEPEAKAGDQQKKDQDQKQQQASGPAGGGKKRPPEDEPNKKSDSKQAAAKSAAAPKPPPQTPQPPPSSSSLATLLAQFAGVLKWIIYALLALFGLYLLIRHWASVVAFLARFWQELLNLWNGLWGVRQTTAAGADPAAEESVPARPFAEFRDPFASGRAAHMEPAELIQYSFEALQAWAREQPVPKRRQFPETARIAALQTPKFAEGRENLGRSPQETPLEFADRLGVEAPAVAKEAKQLVSLYGRLAYAGQIPTAECVPMLERLWRRMQVSESVQPISIAD